MRAAFCVISQSKESKPQVSTQHVVSEEKAPSTFSEARWRADRWSIDCLASGSNQFVVDKISDDATLPPIIPLKLFLKPSSLVPGDVAITTQVCSIRGPERNIINLKRRSQRKYVENHDERYPIRKF